MAIIYPTEVRAVTQTALKPKVNENSVDRKLLKFPFRKV